MKIGIDIGGSHIAMAIVDNQNKIVKKTEVEYTSKGDMTEFVKKALIDGMQELIEGRGKERIEKIGISVPGIANGSSAENLVNLGIKKLDFSFLEEKYNTKVTTRNDGNSATLAEKNCGALQGYNNCVFLCLGTGIGGGAFVNNELITDKNNNGFEIGHMVIERNGIQCTCGKKGCFERYCSMKLFRKNIKDVLENKYKDKTIFERKYINDILIDEINDKNVQKVIDEYIENLIIGLSNIIDLFEPEAICFGGSFAFYKQFMYEKLKTEMNNRRYAYYKNKMPELLIAELNNDAGIIGAVI